MKTSDAIRRLDRAASWLAWLLANIAALSAVLLTVTVTYGVVMRFVFGEAQNWTDELAAFSLLWLVFLGLAYTLDTGSHIRIDFFVDRLPPRLKRVAETATYAVGLAFAVLLFLGCLSAMETFLRRGTRSTGGLDMPLWLPATALLVGSAAFSLVMLARGLRVMLKGPDVPADSDEGKPPA